MGAETDILHDLLEEHEAEQPRLRRLAAYYSDGHYDNLDVPAQARPHYKNLVESAVTNWLRLVVETTSERLIVDGFRTGNEPLDAELWRWWQANGLDGRQMQLNAAASRDGIAYVGVWPSDGDNAPIIVPEQAAGLTVRFNDDLDPTKPTDALKTRGHIAWLYRDGADTITRFRKAADGGRWEVDTEITNPLAAVPFVAFRCNADLSGGYASDLDPAIPINNRITETTIDRLLASRLSAFRQRYAIGLELDEDEDGNPIAPFDAAVDRVWTTEDPNVKFGEFGEATLSNYINAVEADVNHLAAVTRTPAHYLLGKMVNLSAEALAAAETGLARKVSERQQTHGEAWEDVIRLAAKAADRDDDLEDVETIWRNTETVSDAQRVDAATKLSSLGVPTEALWERVGATPQQITRWRRMARSDALRDALRSPLMNDGAADPDLEETPA